MEIKVATQTLREALNKIQTVISRKSSRPILSYTSIEARDGHLHISATDLDVSVKILVEAKIEREGSFCANAKNLAEILKEMPGVELTLITRDDDESVLNLFCDDIFYTLLIYRSDEFPHLDFSLDGDKFVLSGNEILNFINKTFHAISNDETRIYLNGLFLHRVEDQVRAVATDGHRLSLYQIKNNSVSSSIFDKGVIIPKKGVYELKKMAENYSEGLIEFSLDQSFLFVGFENKHFLGIRLISRDFPKYHAVIPDQAPFKLVVDKPTLLNAIRRIKIMSNEKSHGIRFHFKNNELVIAANNPGLGKAQERVDVQYDGKEMEMGFNARYLIDAINVIEDEKVILEFNNELSPATVKSESAPEFLSIVMPLKL